MFYRAGLAVLAPVVVAASVPAATTVIHSGERRRWTLAGWVTIAMLMLSIVADRALATDILPSEPTHSLVRDDLEAWLDGYMPYTLQRADVAGAVVVVVKGGEVLLQKGYGDADRETRRPVDPQNTLFRPGSISKLITWTAVMQLVEEHRVDLDRDINTYLDFRIPPFEGQPVTLRNLMTHTAGFQDCLKDVVSANAPALALGDFLKKRLPDRIFPPGQITGYSNYGAALAGYVVERVSGQRFEDYVEQHIFLPLDMRHTTFRQPPPASFMPLMSSGYIAAADGRKPFEALATGPAGGATTTGPDMAKFMIAHLRSGEYQGHRILQPATAQAMHDTAFTTASPVLNRMALGFFQSNRNGHRIVGHDGDTRMFHSSLLLFLDDDVGLFVSLNSAGRAADTFEIRKTLFEQFTDRYFPPQAVAPVPGSTRGGPVPLATARAHAALMAGQYDGSRREETTFASFVTLLSQVTLSADDRGRLLTPFTKIGGERKTFEEIAPFVWREVDGQELLAAKIVSGKVFVWGEGDDAAGVYTPTPAWRRATWLLPLLLFSVVALVGTALAWPILSVARGGYRAEAPSVGAAARAYRWALIAAASQSVVIAAWLAIIFGMMATFYITWLPYLVSSSMEKWIFIAHLLSVLILPLATLGALWNSWISLRARAGWRGAFSGIWSLVIAASSNTKHKEAKNNKNKGFGVAF